MNGSGLPENPSPTEACPSGSKRLRPGACARAPGTSIPGVSDAASSGCNERHAAALCLTGDIVAAFVSNNAIPIASLSGVIDAVYAALCKIGRDACREEPAPTPFVTVGRSIRPDHIVCLVCGHRGKSLKQHLRIRHRLTPDEYRRSFGLPPDYPMVAPEYAMRRREIALHHGLGRRDTSAKPGSRPEATDSLWLPEPMT